MFVSWFPSGRFTVRVGTRLAVPAQAMKAYSRKGGTNPLIFKLDTSWRGGVRQPHTPAYLPRDEGAHGAH